MHAFKDNTGRVWEITITVAQVKRVRGLLNIDLYKLIDDGLKPLSDLLTDPCNLVDVVYVLCKDQADKVGITDEQFGQAMGGDALEQAAESFLAELVDFFPKQAREGLQKILRKGRAIGAKLLEGAHEKLDRIDTDKEASTLMDTLMRPRGSSA